MNTWQLEFSIARVAHAAEGQLFRIARKGRPEPAAEAHWTERDGALTVCLWFDYSDVPLTLRGRRVQPGDRVRVRFLGYRLELYVNGALQDEEWPFGNHYLAGVAWPAGVSLQYWNPETERAHAAAPQPTVLGSFPNAEGWHPAEDVWVGDCMPFSHDGAYHVFYLKDRRHHRSKWGKGGHQWEHISTRDLVHWDVHPTALPIDRQNEGSICTGSTLFHDGKLHAFYTVRTMDGSPAPLCCATSTDGAHFTKREMHVILGEKYQQASARDPKVFADANGLFHMFVTTSIRRDNRSADATPAFHWQGCLAHLTARDLAAWREEPEPAFLTEEYPPDHPAPWMIEPECPDYFHKDGWYYLVSRSHYWMSGIPSGRGGRPTVPKATAFPAAKCRRWRSGRATVSSSPASRSAWAMADA